MGMFGRRRDAYHWLERGRASLLQGKGSQAETAFGHVLRDQPQNLEALKGLMEAWLLQGKSHGVIEQFDGLPTLQQDRWHELLLIALAMQVGHLKVEGYLDWLRLPRESSKRLSGIRKLSKEYTKCGALAIQWVESALLTYHIDEANQALRQLRDAEPRVSPKLIAHLYSQRDALLLKKAPDIDQALHQASELQDPEDRIKLLLPFASERMSLAPLQRDIGLAFFEASQPERAMRFLNRAVNANPYWVNAWVELGLAGIACGRLVRAREALFRAIYLSDSPWVGNLHEEIEIKLMADPELSRMEPALDRLVAGDPAGAIEPLQRALEINDERASIHYLMGRAYSEMGELSRSTMYLRDALQLVQPGEEELKTKVCRMLEHDLHIKYLRLVSDDWAEEAVDLLDEALQTDSVMPLLSECLRLAKHIHAGSLPMEAVLVYEDGRPNDVDLPFESMRAMRTALALAPDFAEARITQAVLVAQAGDFEMAEDELQSLLTSSLPLSYVQLQMAGVCFLKQEFERADEFWLKASQGNLDPWSELASSNLNTLHSGVGGEIVVFALPTYQHILPFKPGQRLDGMSFPSQDNLFQISPSMEMDHGEFSMQEALEKAASEIPRFSKIAPTGGSLANHVLAQEQTEPEDILKETEALSDVSLFDRPDEKKKRNPDFPYSTGRSSTEVPTIASQQPMQNRPLFDISPSTEVQEVLPTKQLEQQAEIALPKLSDLAPTSEDSSVFTARPDSQAQHWETLDSQPGLPADDVEDADGSVPATGFRSKFKAWTPSANSLPAVEDSEFYEEPEVSSKPATPALPPAPFSFLSSDDEERDSGGSTSPLPPPPFGNSSALPPAPSVFGANPFANSLQQAPADSPAQVHPEESSHPELPAPPMIEAAAQVSEEEDLLLPPAPMSFPQEESQDLSAAGLDSLPPPPPSLDETIVAGEEALAPPSPIVQTAPFGSPVPQALSTEPMEPPQPVSSPSEPVAPEPVAPAFLPVPDPVAQDRVAETQQPSAEEPPSEPVKAAPAPSFSSLDNLNLFDEQSDLDSFLDGAFDSLESKDEK